MANTKRINQILEKIGFEAQEGKTIVVSYAPVNLSDRIVKLLSFNKGKEGVLELPYSSIRGVNVSESGLSYRIDIQLENEVISLMAQQAELSAFRMSGMYSLEDWTFINNWHAKNLKGTLKALKEIGG